MDEGSRKATAVGGPASSRWAVSAVLMCVVRRPCVGLGVLCRSRGSVGILPERLLDPSLNQPSALAALRPTCSSLSRKCLIAAIKHDSAL
jgi:hypothetical protein